ncbi:MAG: DNA repair protein RadA [Chloroflexota bacterium]|nr:DNA repair protein RadA [Chloroflexia bacterium]MDQ3225687.1 DNA repair protein RadA [Chloroflexota bacterium]
MAKVKTTFVCQQCGASSPAFLGRCPSCEAWSTMIETIDERRNPAIAAVRPHAERPQPLTVLGASVLKRIPVPIVELDRVLGGGLVPGTLVLIGGDPGIGKSTLVLQAAAALANDRGPVLYVSAEESAQQIRLRADRLGIISDQVLVMSSTDLDAIVATASSLAPALLIVDSIQTVSVDDISSAAGSVSQVRECTSRLMQWGKSRDIPVFIIGHVTKEGAIAGPRVLEHMVDAVLYLEGERHGHFRVLRAVKNRFGSTDEVGVFEMAESGLREVRNPSEAFLAERHGHATGSSVAVTVEGTRPILVEVQALTSQSAFGLPRRSANGFDAGRLQLLVAVLQKRVGLALAGQDIYANVVGGMRIGEPAADLAVALAIASSFRDRPVDTDLVAVGEIGLSGELRSVSQIDRRLGEASRLGFSKAVIPASAARRGTVDIAGLSVQRADTVGEAIEISITDS